MGSGHFASIFFSFLFRMQSSAIDALIPIKTCIKKNLGAEADRRVRYGGMGTWLEMGWIVCSGVDFEVSGTDTRRAGLAIVNRSR